MPYSVGDSVRFRREEPIKDCDGSLYRWERWVQEGTVTSIRPDGRLEVSFDDAHWGRAITTLSVTEVLDSTPARDAEEVRGS